VPLSELLSQNPIFSHLDSAGKNTLSEMAIARRYPKGGWITHHGDIWPYFFIVESGKINAIKESSMGRSLNVLTLERGDVLWGLAFFQEEVPMPVGLAADEDSQIYLWSQDRLQPFLLENGRLSWELARLMVLRMQHASDIVEELAFQPVTGRLARLLLELYGETVEDYVARDLTLDEMAARIGTTREMVCRQLYHFADEGAIHINRTEFMISNREHLERLAGLLKR
jgi:CRP-like cAMP-binding protein